ncbi:MAG: hypothetical protein ACI9LM_005342 [Alteromonadaceae bacterium]|jgi:hypothetical protein
MKEKIDEQVYREYTPLNVDFSLAPCCFFTAIGLFLNIVDCGVVINQIRTLPL